MTLPNGVYKTEKGSTLTISGKHSGIVILSFDWLEEDACVDCEVSPYPEDGFLVWNCEYCGGGSAELILQETIDKQ